MKALNTIPLKLLKERSKKTSCSLIGGLPCRDVGVKSKRKFYERCLSSWFEMIAD